MLDYQTERKLESILSQIEIPESMNTQPRNNLGQFTEIETDFKFDYNKVQFVRVNENTYIRVRKTRYLILDATILLGFLTLIALIF